MFELKETVFKSAIIHAKKLLTKVQLSALLEENG